MVRKHARWTLEGLSSVVNFVLRLMAAKISRSAATGFVGFAAEDASKVGSKDRGKLKSRGPRGGGLLCASVSRVTLGRRRRYYEGDPV